MSYPLSKVYHSTVDEEQFVPIAYKELIKEKPHLYAEMVEELKKNNKEYIEKTFTRRNNRLLCKAILYYTHYEPDKVYGMETAKYLLTFMKKYIAFSSMYCTVGMIGSIEVYDLLEEMKMHHSDVADDTNIVYASTPLIASEPADVVLDCTIKDQVDLEEKLRHRPMPRRARLIHVQNSVNLSSCFHSAVNYGNYDLMNHMLPTIKEEYIMESTYMSACIHNDLKAIDIMCKIPRVINNLTLHVILYSNIDVVRFLIDLNGCIPLTNKEFSKIIRVYYLSDMKYQNDRKEAFSLMLSKVNTSQLCVIMENFYVFANVDSLSYIINDVINKRPDGKECLYALVYAVVNNYTEADVNLVLDVIGTEALNEIILKLISDIYGNALKNIKTCLQRATIINLMPDANIIVSTKLKQLIMYKCYDTIELLLQKGFYLPLMELYDIITLLNNGISYSLICERHSTKCFNYENKSKYLIYVSTTREKQIKDISNILRKHTDVSTDIIDMVMDYVPYAYTY